MDRIYIQIASYRDSDLPNTVRSALENAEHPARLRFGICWQYDERTITDLDPFLDDHRFRVAHYFYEQSRGCCWARHKTNLLYEDEEYTLQIDAHTRFAPRWDSRFIEMLGKLDSPKPLLTTYPAPFLFKNGGEELLKDRGVQRLTLNRVRKDLTTIYRTEKVGDESRCAPSQFIGAGQIFTHGRFCREVEYDPELYYAGEEINLSARAYSWGYDFFCPNEDLLWHWYQHDMPTHWSDHHPGLHDEAVIRLRTLLAGDHATLGKYGFGKQRTLKEFEQYCGIDFKQRLVRRPTPMRYHNTIEFDVSKIENRTDYDYWIFTLKNVDDEEIYRYDIHDRDILLKSSNSFELDVQLEDEPVSYMLWPHVRGEGYQRQYFFDIRTGAR